MGGKHLKKRYTKKMKMIKKCCQNFKMGENGKNKLKKFKQRRKKPQKIAERFKIKKIAKNF